MKKKMILLAVITLLGGMLSACGKDTAYLSGIKASDYVTLGDYKGIEVTETEPAVTDEYLDAYMSYFLSQQAVSTEVTDRAVEEGDTVNIDYVGYRDGVAFDGGTAQGQNLTIGSGSYIEGFETGLIGKIKGDTVTLDLVFPENYVNAEMAGAAVTFEVTINSITALEAPELTDELIQGLAIDGCNTVEEYRDYVYGHMYEDAVSTYNTMLRNDITQAAMANCIFKEPPEKMVDRYYDILLDGMTAQAAANNMNLGDYMLTYYNMDTGTYQVTFRADAKTMAEQYIMFQAIADAEGLNLSGEDIARAMEERAADYGYESAEEFKEEADGDTFAEYMMADTVVEFLIENAVINVE